MGKIYFYDTCALLQNPSVIEKYEIHISYFTLKELEEIKNSSKKDEDIKYQSRKLLHKLLENQNNLQVIRYSEEIEQLRKVEELIDNNDGRIIATALFMANNSNEVEFYTSDMSCRILATSVGLKTTQLVENNNDEYTGFKEITLTEEELAKFYNEIAYTRSNPYKLLSEEYLIIKNSKGEIVDKYRWSDKLGYYRVPYCKFDSKTFGKITPKDEYQHIAMEALKNHKITMLRGKAGSGKSYLSFGYMFELLEKGIIDKIIIFCNTVATKGSAKLGFYPGSRDEKLLDSQIGNLLSSKLGDKIAVERMIQDGSLVLLPMSDIRGYDTTGMRAAVYISEAQNLDIELMKLALQRIGDDSICILDGDSNAQVDLTLYAGNNNGMRRVSEIFKGHELYAEVTLQHIHRSEIAELADLM